MINVPNNSAVRQDKTRQDRKMLYSHKSIMTLNYHDIFILQYC